jgi:hypothetical protein
MNTNNFYSPLLNAQFSFNNLNDEFPALLSQKRLPQNLHLGYFYEPKSLPYAI